VRYKKGFFKLLGKKKEKENVVQRRNLSYTIVIEEKHKRAHIPNGETASFEKIHYCHVCAA
jgi:hypothetical protein